MASVEFSDEDATNVLVTTDDLEACTACLEHGASGERAELTVEFPAADAADVGFGDRDRPEPATKGLIAVGDRMRSAAPDDRGGPSFDGPVAQDAIADPTNLQRLGTSVSEFCQRWDDEGYDIRVCFHSLTALLEHASPEVVFQFCHVLTERLDSVDADAHFHLDPGEHPDDVLDTVDSLFDATVDEAPDATGDAPDATGGEEGSPAAPGEASDDDVHAVADDWNDDASYSIVGDDADRPDDVTEATDDEIADRLPDNP